ncbi:hypothetical protein BASA81_001807 [Batrachochytrium salamandrivorans]|nr:hypothetical protein BASA81_001807 [Batrachochytrium salamandrivorans]
MDEELLERLEREERQVLEAKALALESSLVQSLKESERGLESVRRALPELDLVSKTAGELRASIHKTMERADVVSVKVRELDLSRSRALEALHYANKCLDARQYVRGARQALADSEVEIAAGYVQRFDELANSTTPKQQFGTAQEEMLQIRNELERSILFAKDQAPLSPGSSHHNQQQQAMGENWLQASAIKEALKHANVMSKVASEDASAEIRYAHFLASFLRDRMQGYLQQERLMDGNAMVVIGDKQFVEAFKFLFNSSCALIESQLAVKILSKRAKPHIFKAIHGECDKQSTVLFDLFMSTRRIHEQASSTSPSANNNGTSQDLTKLNQLLTEMCIIMQHVESYDRFTRSIAASLPQLSQQQQQQPEYKRVLQEVAGAYTMLERLWISQSLKRAKQVEQVVDTTNMQQDSAVLRASSLVEDSFYLCKRAVRRALGTGSCDAACGCINQVVGCLEDALFSPSPLLDGAVQVNSLEVSAQYARELHLQIVQTMGKTFERPEELAKTRAGAEALLDLAKQLDENKLECIRVLIAPTLQSWKQPIFIEAMDRVSYNLDDKQFALLQQQQQSSQHSEYVDKLVGQIHPLHGRFSMEMSEQSFQCVCELVAQRVAEDMEKQLVVKHFSQLGALALEQDLRAVADSVSQISINSLMVRAMFARLFQIATLLGISTLGEAHDVWDSFAQKSQQQGGAVKPRSGLTAKEAKRLLPLRQDFRQKDRTILDVVHASHRITVHALQFLKLYLLSCFENGVKLPLVTEHLVVSIMNVLCEESEHQETRGRRCNPATLTLKQKLLEFHREHYKLTMTNPREKLGFTNKAQLLHRRGCGQGL